MTDFKNSIKIVRELLDSLTLPRETLSKLTKEDLKQYEDLRETILVIHTEMSTLYDFKDDTNMMLDYSISDSMNESLRNVLTTISSDLEKLEGQVEKEDLVKKTENMVDLLIKYRDPMAGLRDNEKLLFYALDMLIKTNEQDQEKLDVVVDRIYDAFSNCSLNFGKLVYNTTKDQPNGNGNDTFKNLAYNFKKFSHY